MSLSLPFYLVCRGAYLSSREDNIVHLTSFVGPSVDFCIIQSTTLLNKTADVTQPCLTPDFTLNVIFEARGVLGNLSRGKKDIYTLGKKEYTVRPKKNPDPGAPCLPPADAPCECLLEHV